MSSPKESNEVESETDPLKGNHSKYQEVSLKASWSLSSCKPGLGVDALLDNRLDTYWQSDGLLPHLINLEFIKKTLISDVYLYIDYKLDESYTPSRISIRAGTYANDLQEIEVLVLTEPSGWIHIPIKNMADEPIKVFMLQIAVISNHQNGRDTHIRQVKLYSPKSTKCVNFDAFFMTENQKFSTVR